MTERTLKVAAPNGDEPPIDPRLIGLMGSEFVAMQELIAAEQGWPSDTPVELHPDNPIPAMRVDWAELFASDHVTADWLIEPLIARGRGHAIYAPAKSGKSFMLLDVCAHAASGARTLHHTSAEPMTVVYVDYEMTDADLLERLEALGFDEDSPLAQFHYIRALGIPPLDRADGGRWILNYARAVDAQFVALDTFARAVEGEENDSDTIRDFYRHTGARLKGAGIAWARLDNTGKVESKGARGSSGKNDDVDIVWSLTTTENGIKLTRTHARMQWVPPTVDLATGGDPFKHRIGAKDWPAGTSAMAQELIDLDVPIDLPVRAVKKLLREKQIKRRNDIVEAAIKYRRGDEIAMGTRRGTGKRDSMGTRGEVPAETPGNIDGDAHGDAGGRSPRGGGPVPVPIKGTGPHGDEEEGQPPPDDEHEPLPDDDDRRDNREPDPPPFDENEQPPE